MTDASIGLSRVVGRQKTGDRRRKTEDRRWVLRLGSAQETGDGRRKTEDRRRETEDGRPKWGDRCFDWAQHKCRVWIVC
jgi:hypothetical protein